MTSTNRRNTLKGMAAGALALGAGPLLAQDRSTMTVLVGAASSMDFTARLIADYLRDSLGRPVVAVSKLGAGGRVALGELQRSAPDGRTIMLSTSSAFVIFPNIYAKLEYDPAQDFTPIMNCVYFDIGIAVAPQLGINSIQELVAWGKKQSSEVIYGCAPGTGSASHFTGIALDVASGMKLKPIPYKNSGEGIADTIGGRIPVMITGTSPLAAQHKGGKLKLLATSGPDRSPLAPDVPTLKESGIDANVVVNAGLFGPKGLPAENVKEVYDAVSKMLAQPEMRERLGQQGMSIRPMDGPSFAAMLEADRKHYAELAKAGGIVPLER